MGKEQGIIVKKLTNAFAFLVKNKRGRELIHGAAGKYTFCKNCERYNVCDKKEDKPKILRFSEKMLIYFIEKEKPFSGGIFQQPKFFNAAMNALSEKMAAIKAEQSGN